MGKMEAKKDSDFQLTGNPYYIINILKARIRSVVFTTTSLINTVPELTGYFLNKWMSQVKNMVV